MEITPIVENEEKDVVIVKEESTEESFPILRPNGKRTNVNELIEKQNSGLDHIKQMNEMVDEINIAKEISNHVPQDEDITIVEDKKPDLGTPDISIDRSNEIFDYNTPIHDSTFSSPEGEKEILNNLKDTLESLKTTKEISETMYNDIKNAKDTITKETKEESTVEVKEIVNTVKEEPVKEDVPVVEEKKDNEDSFTITVDKNDIEVEKKVEKPTKGEDNSFAIDNDDPSIFTDVGSLLEEDLYTVTNDVSSDIVVPLSSLEVIAQAADDSDPANYREVIRNNPRYRGFLDKLTATISDQKSYLNRIHRANQLFYSAQQNFNKNALDAAVKRNNDVSKRLTGSARVGDKVIKDVMANKEDSLRKLDDGATIKGNLAITTAVMLTQGIKRVQLYNSGFNIDVRAPKLSELGEFWKESTSTQDEYGRLLGQLCYLPADIHYKRAAMNLLEKLVVNSNLADFNVAGTLRKAISLLDFDTVMWAIGSLMFPKGVEVDYICHNGTCRYTEKSKISVTDMRYNDWSLLTAESIQYTISNDKRTLNDLSEYRKSIKNRGVTKKINNEWSAVFRIPTMYEIEESHLSHLADISHKVQLTALQDVSMYVAVKYYGILSPFVEKLVYKSPETGKVINIVGETLSGALEALQSDSDIDFSKTVNDFVDDTKISHICFTFNKCPKCGNLPTSAIGHLIPCDVHRIFFTWMFRRLTELV